MGFFNYLGDGDYFSFYYARSSATEWKSRIKDAPHVEDLGLSMKGD